ncbi:hypothetical protein JZU54_01150, partial [bacterium]|nr:hypothetical protein [bacterium]
GNAGQAGTGIDISEFCIEKAGDGAANDLSACATGYIFGGCDSGGSTTAGRRVIDPGQVNGLIDADKQMPAGALAVTGAVRVGIAIVKHPGQGDRASRSVGQGLAGIGVGNL